ncbi:hypothetical protein C0J52_15293 [Blattella germanica]|nr:hypothetical protein C0J52_15293 [Blattella germanica]
MLRSMSKYLHPQTKRLLCNNYASLRFLSSKEITQSPSLDTQDFLLQNIRSSTDTSDVLQIVGNHYSIMNAKHVVQALRSLFELKKSGHCQFSKDQLTNNPDFLQLCKRLKSQSRALSLNDTIEALKVVSYIGVSSKSLIIQILLQLIRQGVNDLSLHQIIFVEFMLKTFERGPLIDALKIALPLVFETQLRLKMDREDISHLADLLKYASKKSSEASVKLITDCIEMVMDDINVKTAKSIVRSLSEIKIAQPSHRTILEKCWDVLIRDIDQCSYDEVEELAHRMTRKCSGKQTYFYNEAFADSCAKYIVTNDCGFDKGTWILKKLTRMKITDNPQIGETCKASAFIGFISGMANADYKPPGWDSIQQSLLKNPIMEAKEQLELPWIRVAVDLAALDVYPPELLKLIFDEEFLNQFFSRDYNILDRLQLLLLYQAIVTLYPSYSGPLPPKEIIESAMELNGDHVEEFPLQAALVRGLGGPSILVLCMSEAFYNNNCQRLRSVPSLTLRTLEALGHTVVPISLQQWTSLPEFEKIPYLMQNIRGKCDSLDSEARIVH